MASVTMNIRMDSDIKQQAQKLFSEFGLDMSTAINMFLRQSIREHGIPFDLRLPTPNKKTLDSMKESEKIIAGKKSRFNSVQEMFDDLEI